MIFNGKLRCYMLERGLQLYLITIEAQKHEDPSICMEILVYLVRPFFFRFFLLVHQQDPKELPEIWAF